jgi:hypothetical protein
MKTRFYQIMAVSALCLAVAALAVALWTSARAQEETPASPLAIPTTLNYQGYLREPDGSLTTGTYAITAKIYSAATGGSPLYTTTLPDVTVRDGLFNIVLGDNPALPASVFANAPLYIGMTMNSGAELIPRQRLHAVPWAFQASTLVNNATVQGLTSNGNVTVNGTTTMNGNATVNGDAALLGDVTIGTANPVSTTLEVSGTMKVLGDRVMYQGDTPSGGGVTQQLATGTANSDGLVVAVIWLNMPNAMNTDCWIYGTVDGITQYLGSAAINWVGGQDYPVLMNSFTMPVRMGETWHITYSSEPVNNKASHYVIYWIPLGQQ